MNCRLTIFAFVSIIYLSAINAEINETVETIDSAAVWNAHCKRCHAEDGSGNTKIGQKFGVRDYTDPNVQASFTDEDIIRITKEGVFEGQGHGQRHGQAHGRKKMPAYEDKLSDEQIEALVPYIRSFEK